MSHSAGCDLRLEIEALHLRHAYIVEKEVKEVLPELPSLHELDGGELKPFLVAIFYPWRPAGVDSANIHVVGGAAYPRDQLALVMNRGDKGNVGKMEGTRMRIIDQEDVARKDLLHAKIRRARMKHIREGCPVPRHPRRVNNSPSFVIRNVKTEVFGFNGRRRSGGSNQSQAGLTRDLRKAVLDNLYRHWIDGFRIQSWHIQGT